MEEEIADMLNQGIIERSNSYFCNPIRIIQKKDASIRICLDIRVSNQYIIADNESTPVIEELLQKYAGTQFLMTTDLTSGY